MIIEINFFNVFFRVESEYEVSFILSPIVLAAGPEANIVSDLNIFEAISNTLIATHEF
jgi:hypothetical protein